MITSQTTVVWLVEVPRVAGSHHQDDWFPLSRYSTQGEALGVIQDFARSARDARSGGGWRLSRVETRTDYLATYMNADAVLGPPPTQEGNEGYGDVEGRRAVGLDPG